QPLVALRGTIVDEPVPRERTQRVRLRVDAVRFADGEWNTTFGYAQITTRPAPALHYRDVIEVRGTIQAPEADTDAPPSYAAYLRRQGIDAVAGFPTITRLGDEPDGDPLRGALFVLRERLTAGIEAFLPEPQAALVAGILLGRRATIPAELTEQLNRSGTSHLIAISGYNVGIVVGLITATIGGLAGRRGDHGWRRALVAPSASVALWAFVALVGPSGSVVRAAAMAQLALVGRALGRAGTAGSLLLWGSAFLAAWQPDLLVDVGWQLSFLGTAGLIWLSPALAVRMDRLPPMVREALAATLAAQIFVLPVLAGTFGQVSLVAPVANVLGLWLVPAIMLGGAGLVLAATLFPPAAPLLAGLTWVPATGMIRIVQWSASWPWAATVLPSWSAPVTLAYLVGLVALCWYLQGRAEADAPEAPLPSPSPAAGGMLPKLALGGLVALACVAWAMASPGEAAAQPPGLLVSIPAVADGTLALLRAPDGARLLLNGGPGTGSATTLLGEQLRPWDRTVDAVVLADPREAYVLGLARVLERYRT
ncbi:MAG: ComEC/Rec2 family competence protein, partial [Chloroflexota bacterium]